jgi:hypothetical protein
MKPSRRHFLRAGAGALVAALTVAGYIWLRPTAPPLILENVDLGPPRAAGDLQPLAPLGDQTGPPRAMRWRPDPEAATYRILLFDEKLDAIAVWDSDRARPELNLTEAQRELLRPGPRYAWQVEARGPRGQALGRSAMASFRIAATSPAR